MARKQDIYSKAYEKNAETDGGGQLVAQGPQAATFKLLYESRDGKLCVFEDAEGHVTAVKSSRLA